MAVLAERVVGSDGILEGLRGVATFWVRGEVEGCDEVAGGVGGDGAGLWCVVRGVGWRC